KPKASAAATWPACASTSDYRGTSMKRIFLPLLALPLLTAAAPPPAVTAADVRWNAGSYDVSWTTAKPGAPVDVYVSADPLAAPGKMKKLADDDTDGKESFRDPLGAGVRP